MASDAGQSDEVHHLNLSPPDDVSNMGRLLIRGQLLFYSNHVFIRNVVCRGGNPSPYIFIAHNYIIDVSSK